MTDNIEAETFYVKVTSKQAVKTIGLTQALRIAQEELLKHDLRHSEATITRENSLGYPETTVFTVRAGGCYGKPSEAIAHAWPFTVFDPSGKYMGHVNMDGTWIKEVA